MVKPVASRIAEFSFNNLDAEDDQEEIREKNGLEAERRQLLAREWVPRRDTQGAWGEAERALFLVSVPGFRTLPPDALTDIAAAAQPRRVTRGEVVFLEGDPLEALTIVAEGRIKIVRETMHGRVTLTTRNGPFRSLGMVHSG